MLDAKLKFSSAAASWPKRVEAALNEPTISGGVMAKGGSGGHGGGNAGSGGQSGGRGGSTGGGTGARGK